MDEELTLPEFDEEKFMKKELRKAKTAFVSFSFGIIVGIISHVIWRSVDAGIRWPLCFLFAMCAIGFMAKLLQLWKVDVTAFGKKEWFGSIAFYFFTWLAIFILSINPPFYDASAPKIEVVVLPAMQQPGGSFMIAAHITDNSGINDASITIDGATHPLVNDGNDIYVYNHTGGDANYTITVVDRGGNRETYEGTLRYEENLLSVILPGKTADATSEIKIRVHKNVSMETFRVYYLIQGYEINVTQSGVDGAYYIYTTTPRYQGWRENDENVFHVYVETPYYFPGIDRRYVNVIDGGNHTVKTTLDSSIGTEPSPAISGLPQFKSLRTPGFGMVTAIAAVAGVLLFMRRRKR